MDGHAPRPRRGAWAAAAPIICTASAATAVVGCALTVTAPVEAFRRTGTYGDPGPIVVSASLLLGASTILSALVGSVIVVRRPRHPIGWLLIGMALLMSIGSFSQGYVLAAYARPEDLVGGALAAWVNNMVWGPAVALLATALLLFPNGYVIEGWWGRTFATGLAVAAVLMALTALAPGPMPLTLGIANPFGVPALAPIPREVLNTGVLLVVLLTAFAATSLVARYRRSSEVERLQLKWVAVATLVVAAVFTTLAFRGPWDESSDLLFWSSLMTLPIAIGVAILRYRLYAIDVIIRRTLIYGALTAVLGAGYALAVVVLQALLAPVTGGETVGIAAATLLAAAAFRPVLTRIQGLIDRRFYRVRYDIERATADLAARLGREVKPDGIESDLLDTVVEAVRPARVGLWLARDLERPVGELPTPRLP